MPCRSNRPRPLLRVLLPALALIFGSVWAAAWRISAHYEHFLRMQLPVWLSSGTDGVYRVSVDDISVSLLGRRVTLTGVRLWPDSARLQQVRDSGRNPGVVVRMSIPRVQARGMVWEALVTSQELRCRRLSITDPQVSTAHAKRGNAPRPKSPTTVALKSIQISEIDVVGARLRYGSRNGKNAQTFEAIDGMVEVKHFAYLLSVPGKPIVGRLDLRFGKTVFIEQPGFYALSSDSLRWEPHRSLLEIAGLKLTPRYRRIDQRPAVTISTARAAIYGFVLQDLTRHNRLLADSLVLNKPSISTSVDRLLPRRINNKPPEYPQDILNNLPINLQPTLVVVREGMIQYRERSRRTRQTGTISFSGINATISGLRGMKDASLRLTGVFQDHSAFRASATFKLDDKLNSFSIQGNLIDLKAYQLRQTLLALALIRITSLNVSEAQFDIKGNTMHTSSFLRGTYRDLRLQIMSADSVTGAMKPRALASLFANRLVLFPSNPAPGGIAREAFADVARDPQQPFFASVWGSLVTTIKQIVVADEAIMQRASLKSQTKAERTENRSDRREKRKARRAARRARKGIIR